jgi:hypothetical protein
MVAPPASRAALWLAKSMPLAYPDTTVTPRLESCQAQSCAALMPLILALRDPTIPTAGVRSRPALPRISSSLVAAVVMLSISIGVLFAIRQGQFPIGLSGHDRIHADDFPFLIHRVLHVFLQDRFAEDRGGRKVRPD